MGKATDNRATPAPAASGHGVALGVLAIQCVLALSWTLYVLYLPGLLASAGIARRWLVYVLIADQALFALFDRLAGARADRRAAAWRRVGGAVAAVSLLSSVALLAMPWFARAGQPTLLLVTIFVWAASTSALRAPVFALLGRVREAAPGRETAASPADRVARSHLPAIDRAGTIALALAGIGLAGALSPYLTALLAGADARLPIAVGALGLAAAGLWAARIERMLPRPVAPALRDARLVQRRAWALAAVVLVAGFGTQVVTSIVGPPLFERFVGADAAAWLACFWVGFAIGLVPGARLARRPAGEPLVDAAIALVVGGVAFALAVHAVSSLPWLVACIGVAGAAWGAFSTIVFARAVSLSGGRATLRGAGTASGLLFSAIALGTLLRLGCVALGLNRAPWMPWAPVVAWLAAGALLATFGRTLWRAADDPATAAA